MTGLRSWCYSTLHLLVFASVVIQHSVFNSKSTFTGPVQKATDISRITFKSNSTLTFPIKLQGTVLAPSNFSFTALLFNCQVLYSQLRCECLLHRSYNTKTTMMPSLIGGIQNNLLYLFNQLFLSSFLLHLPPQLLLTLLPCLLSPVLNSRSYHLLFKPTICSK